MNRQATLTSPTESRPGLRPRLEIAALLATSGLFLVFENLLDLKLPYLITVIVLWAAYVTWRLRHHPGQAREWGLGAHGFREALRLCAITFAIGGALILTYRIAMGWRSLPANSIWIFAGYPVWSLIQEFAVQSLIVVNLEKLGVRRAVLIPVAAVLFGISHFPDFELMGLCSVAGVFWAMIFLRARNLYPIALCHAWLGTLAFYWILERDPIGEMVPV